MTLLTNINKSRWLLDKNDAEFKSALIGTSPFFLSLLAALRKNSNEKYFEILYTSHAIEHAKRDDVIFYITDNYNNFLSSFSYKKQGNLILHPNRKKEKENEADLYGLLSRT